MKAILEFDLSEDTEEYRMHTQTLAMYSALHEMQQFLRQKIKYADDDVSDDALNAYEECRDFLSQLLVDNQVNLEI